MTTVIDQQVAARAIARVSEMPHHAFDTKTFAHMLRVEPAALIDPFLGIDAFNMPECFFLPHPHGGMSAMTYSTGPFVDSCDLSLRKAISSR